MARPSDTRRRDLLLELSSSSTRPTRYRPRMGFEWAYREASPPPWDIGRPQPVVVRLADEGVFQSRIIDIGCGTGENALFLAERRLDVTGLDAAPTAIARARQKATERGLDVRFMVGDALDLQSLGGTFDTALDCGLFHTLDDPQRVRYEAGLRAILPPGRRFVLLSFSDRQPGTMGPRRVRQAEIRSTFAQGWRIDRIEEARFATNDSLRGPRAPHAWLALLIRT